MKNKSTVPVLEFRPLQGFFHGEFYRYANGSWIVDDGEYDLAFAGTASSGGYPCCLYVDDRRENIVLSWTTKHWSNQEPRHKDGNAWHYALKAGTTSWGELNYFYDHPNRVAGTSGMDFMCSRASCSNGRHVEFHPDDPHIIYGLVRYQDSKEMFSFPKDMHCMYCGEIPKLPQEYYKIRCTHPKEQIVDDGGETFCQLCGHIISSLGDEE